MEEKDFLDKQNKDYTHKQDSNKVSINRVSKQSDKSTENNNRPMPKSK